MRAPGHRGQLVEVLAQRPDEQVGAEREAAGGGLPQESGYERAVPAGKGLGDLIPGRKVVLPRVAAAVVGESHVPHVPLREQTGQEAEEVGAVSGGELGDLPFQGVPDAGLLVAPHRCPTGLVVAPRLLGDSRAAGGLGHAQSQLETAGADLGLDIVVVGIVQRAVLGCHMRSFGRGLLGCPVRALNGCRRHQPTEWGREAYRSRQGLGVQGACG